MALPAEHGGWGFLLEPILLGLLVAASWAGALLALAALGVFLLHQPLKIAVKDRLKGQRPARTVWAERFAIGYGLLALIPMLVLLASVPADFVLPITLAVPLASLQLYYDARNQSRKFVPEIAGAAALAMIAPAIVMLAGWSLAAGLILWLVLALRAVTSILYVRARLKLEHGETVSPTPVWVAHGAALVGTTALAALRMVPTLTIVPFVVLLGRAWLGLSAHRQPRRAKVIGFQEMGYGLFTVACIALGYSIV
ncbi:MAG: YwiC-like family protein [Aggregatilineales bacterium]